MCFPPLFVQIRNNNVFSCSSFLVLFRSFVQSNTRSFGAAVIPHFDACTLQLVLWMHFSNPVVESLLPHIPKRHQRLYILLDDAFIDGFDHIICGFNCVAAGSVFLTTVRQVVVYHVKEVRQHVLAAQLVALGALSIATHRSAQSHTSRTKFDLLLSSW